MLSSRAGAGAGAGAGTGAGAGSKLDRLHNTGSATLTGKQYLFFSAVKKV